MRDEDVNEYGNMFATRYACNPDHDGGIYTAVDAWEKDPAAAMAKYGPIASWDTSGITNMYQLFYNKKDFNEDISRWNVSNVVKMSCMFDGATSFDGDLSSWKVTNVVEMGLMFDGATSFDRQLGGAWFTSTADKRWMFGNSPGTIAGKTKLANGTIE